MAHDLVSLLRQIRARNVLKDIADGVERNMPCGDQRLAALLLRFGAIRIVDNKKRSFTHGYEATEIGKSLILG